MFKGKGLVFGRRDGPRRPAGEIARVVRLLEVLREGRNRIGCYVALFCRVLCSSIKRVTPIASRRV